MTLILRAADVLQWCLQLDAIRKLGAIL